MSITRRRIILDERDMLRNFISESFETVAKVCGGSSLIHLFAHIYISEGKKVGNSLVCFQEQAKLCAKKAYGQT